MDPACRGPASSVTDIALLGQVEEEGHGVLEGLASLEKLGLVAVVGQEDLTVGDVLVDLVLGVWGFIVLVTLDEMAKAKEVGDVSSDDRDGEAGDC